MPRGMFPAATEQKGTGALGLIAYWPVALAAGLRLAVWLMLPANRFACDEQSYYRQAQPS